MTQGLGVGAALYTPRAACMPNRRSAVPRARLEQVLPRWRIGAGRGHRLGQRLACPRSCPPGRSSSCSSFAFAAGCGGGGKDPGDEPRQPVVGQGGDDEEAGASLGFPGFATKNTTRVGGADPVADAAGVAQAVFTARSRDTRPASVTLVDAKDWRAAISAAQLMSRPLRSPILLSDGEDLPDATQSALDELGPTGAEKAGNAQVIRVGKTAKPEGAAQLPTSRAPTRPRSPQAIDRLHTAAAGAPSRAVIVAPSSAPEFAMPAAGWAAKAGDPVLWTDRDALPAATKAAITAHRRPRIYVLGPPSVISDAVLKELGELGTARRISGAGAGRQRDRLRALHRRALRLERRRPRPRPRVREAPSAPPTPRPPSALSAAGTYGPLLLVTEANVLPRPLQDYLLDVQPGYDDDPVRGVYNHGWIVGRREGDLGRRAVAHRRAARDPARAARAS